jgi:hypothetical protein
MTPLDAIQDMVLGAALKGATASMISTKDAKAPLRIQTTTQNFRRFVVKGGPVFRAQDQVESVLRWESTPKTLFVGAMWAALCTFGCAAFGVGLSWPHRLQPAPRPLPSPGRPYRCPRLHSQPPSSTTSRSG